jgi:hypothetical protein
MSKKSGDNTFVWSLMILIIIAMICSKYWENLEERMKNGVKIGICEKIFLVFVAFIAYIIVDFIMSR